MSKQSEAKKKQDYVPDFKAAYCMHCENFTSDIVKNEGSFGTWTQEKNMRCGLGGFAVKKKGSCLEFVGKADPVTTDCDAGVEA